MAHDRSRTHDPSVNATNGPSVWWLFCASSWLLLLLVPSGALAWLAFGIVGAVGGRRSWGIAAGVYAIAAILAQIPEDPAGGIVRGSLYLVILVHGLIINQAWLQLSWARRENGLNVFGRTPAESRAPGPAGPRQKAAMSEEAERLLGASGTSRSDYVDDATPAPRRRKRPTRAQRRAAEAAAKSDAINSASSASSASSAASSPVRTVSLAEPEGDLVDVNTANQRTLAKLTGMDRGSAKAIIAERSKRGGFVSLDDFAAKAGLQPHEIVRLRNEAFCSPRPRAPRTFGRRVDY